MDQFVGDDMNTVISPELSDGGKKIVLITNDESSFDAHDGKRFVWKEVEKQSLYPKGSGRSIMILQFLCQCHGAMEVTLTEELFEQYPSLSGTPGDVIETVKVIKPGKNADGYWTNKDLVDQLCLTQTVFKFFHPDCIALFVFDNSQNHLAMGPDALIANRLNLKDGGKNVPHIRPGWYEKDGIFFQQEMQYEGSGKYAINGRIQKGIQQILNERGLWPNSGLLLDAAKGILQAQPDFAGQRMWLQETIDGLGSLLIMYPKFHPEFNWIEMYWAACKHYCRKYCTYSFKDLVRIIPEALKFPTLATLRRFARKSFRYIDAYRSKNGEYLTRKQVEHAVRIYRGHRGISASIMAEL